MRSGWLPKHVVSVSAALHQGRLSTSRSGGESERKCLNGVRAHWGPWQLKSCILKWTVVGASHPYYCRCSLLLTKPDGVPWAYSAKNAEYEASTELFKQSWEVVQGMPARTVALRENWVGHHRDEMISLAIQCCLNSQLCTSECLSRYKHLLSWMPFMRLLFTLWTGVCCSAFRENSLIIMFRALLAKKKVMEDHSKEQSVINERTNKAAAMTRENVLVPDSWGF